ncbi:MAG: response regulator [Syntrophobacteraceae bacterium]|jgi:two-component system phosphate regulon response regulator PhoB
MSKPNVLIVEDDRDILQLLTYNLKAAGFEIATCQDGYEALAEVRRQLPDIVLLDLLLPGLDGLEICKELKRGQETKNTPVIMITARGEEVDRVVGLELGADDYVVKPFSPRELILRIKAVLRRSTPHDAESVWQEDGLRLEMEAHRATVDGDEVSLTATEFKLLSELVRNKGKVQTRDQLLDKVWGYHFNGYARTVDTHVRRLRQKLSRHADRIETIRGVGYRFRG